MRYITLMRDSYKIPDGNTFFGDRAKKADKLKSSLIPADYLKEYGSTIKHFYKGHEDQQCELAVFLKRSGLKNLFYEWLIYA